MNRAHRPSRPPRPFTLAIAALATVVVAACSSDEGGEDPGQMPVPSGPDASREIPVRGGQPDDLSLDEPDFDPFPEDGEERDLGLSEEFECCEVRFAIADPYDGADADYVRLRGTAFPLHEGEGVTLTLMEGVWSGSACVPSLYDGVYFYEVGRDIKDANGDPYFYVERLANQAATGVSETADGPANVWNQAGTCDTLDGSIHARTMTGG